MTQTQLAAKLVAYMTAKGYTIFTGPGEINIAYLEGANFDGEPNKDDPDKFNDRRILFEFKDGVPEIILNTQATTEPGLSATFSAQAKNRGGVARIAFGQFTSWQMGFHRGDPKHPALRQCKPIPVYRDINRDGKRTGDPVSNGSGINQHGTNGKTVSDRVGNWSEGCLVGFVWDEHMKFIDLLRTDPRFIADPKFVFTSAVIDGDDFGRFKI